MRPPFANPSNGDSRFVQSATRLSSRPELVQPARLKLALLDPQLRRDPRIVAAHLLDEPLRVLAPDEHLECVTEWEVSSYSAKSGYFRGLREWAVKDSNLRPWD